jgi:hypothetical protein
VSHFRLAVTAPMGTKRSGVKGAFIVSVRRTVEDFYREVVQPLRPWVPPAPKLPVDEGIDDVAAVDPAEVSAV